MAYNPASNLSTSSSLAHLATVYYDRTALKPLRKKFLFWKGVDNRIMPKKNGKTIQFYRYSQLGANTATTSEGTVGTAIGPMTSTTVSATVSQYSDFMSFSDLLIDTAIDGDIVAVGADQLGYRAGLTFDTIVRNEVDSVAASIDVLPLGDYFSSADLANIRTRFAAVDVMPFGAYFPVISSPYCTYDLVHDPQVGGFMDVTKQAGAQQKEVLYNMGGADTSPVLRFNSCEVYESNNVTVVAGSPNKYRNYFFGQEGVGAIDLAGRGPTRTEDQDRSKFSINVIKESGPSVANPEGKIKAIASYNVVFATKILDTTNYRMRKIDAATSLGL